MNIIWLSDTHFDFFKMGKVERFFKKIEGLNPCCVIHSGDIANAKLLIHALKLYERTVSVPLYFVLGNHDFYGSSFAKVKEKVGEFVKTSEKLFWLTIEEPLKISDETVLTGDDGWADARLGDPYGSRMSISDFIEIEDVFLTATDKRVKLYRKIADESARRLKTKLDKAVNMGERILIVIHPSPFKETTLYGGVISDNEGLPWFSSKIIGDLILEFSEKYRDKEFIVLGGHTHDKAEKRIRNNLMIYIAGAEYYRFQLRKIIITKNKLELFDL